MRRLHHCKCWKCGHEWLDFPGQWAKLTRPQYPGDTTDGCPSCGGLYWTETPNEPPDVAG